MSTAVTHCGPTSRRDTMRPSAGRSPSVSRKLSLGDAAVTASISPGDGEVARRFVDHARSTRTDPGRVRMRGELLAGDQRLAHDAGTVGAEQHEPIGLAVGQRLQENGADDGEHRRRRADAERDDGERGDREQSVADQDANAEAEIAEEGSSLVRRAHPGGSRGGGVSRPGAAHAGATGHFQRPPFFRRTSSSGSVVL